MTERDRVLLAVFLPGVFSKQKLKRVTGRSYSELLEQFPELKDLEEFNLRADVEKSLQLISQFIELFESEELKSFARAFSQSYSANELPYQFLGSRLQKLGTTFSSIGTTDFRSIWS